LASAVDFFGFAFVLSDLFNESLQIFELECLGSGRSCGLVFSSFVKLPVNLLKTTEEVTLDLSRLSFLGHFIPFFKLRINLLPRWPPVSEQYRQLQMLIIGPASPLIFALFDFRLLNG